MGRTGHGPARHREEGSGPGKQRNAVFGDQLSRGGGRRRSVEPVVFGAHEPGRQGQPSFVIEAQLCTELATGSFGIRDGQGDHRGRNATGRSNGNRYGHQRRLPSDFPTRDPAGPCFRLVHNFIGAIANKDATSCCRSLTPGAKTGPDRSSGTPAQGSVASWSHSAGAFPVGGANAEGKTPGGCGAA